MRYCCLIRDQPHYRRDAFEAGLRAIGGQPASHEQCDVLAIWNRYGGWDSDATRCEKRGGTVLVAENGYLGNDFAGSRWYAISKGHHNGAGEWPQGGPERWDGLNIPLAAWRDGGETVILPQRGIGPPGVAMPSDWLARTENELQKRRIRYRVRAHPGVNDALPLEQDLAGAGVVITWGSGAALKALTLGIPVVYDFPRWIGEGAGVPLCDWLAGASLNRDHDARLSMFRGLAWAMWTLEEIRSGEAFRHLGIRE